MKSCCPEMMSADMKVQPLCMRITLLLPSATPGSVCTLLQGPGAPRPALLLHGPHKSEKMNDGVSSSFLCLNQDDPRSVAFGVQVFLL